MLTSIVIIGISSLLFVYWFRYTCILILSTRSSPDYTEQVAEANQLCFHEVQKQVATAPRSALGGLERSLDRDFETVCFLLRHAAALEVGGLPLEQAMLHFNYWAMRLWYRLSLRFSERLARSALAEIALIVAHFANALGERQAHHAPSPSRSH